ncbi:MAG: uracil-DNA glycosylase [Caryophanon sp.]|uniref:Uracil-DNA glycosylase n=1 Tax=Caryophanon latum TaxID=33977 RepID=A0A1C0YHR2_9BACL|nr:uracil-DNA glycosylase [Caryophanon latum]MEE1131172.1 uracil-DNA glycosylase [Caryophanon sp.]OCS86728.1 uracil-DNA glycosylase [Caryophanon latum]
MKVDCFKCAYLRITWEPAHPRACEAHGFKTKQIPSAVVKQTSGMECLYFTPKRGTAK